MTSRPNIQPDSPITQLLVIRTGALGDLIHTSPSVQQIKKRFPNIKIHWLTTALYKPMVEQFEGVDKVWVIEKQKGWLATVNQIFDLANALRTEGIDGVVNLQPNLKFFLLAAATLQKKLTSPTHNAVYYKEKLDLPAAYKRKVPRRHAIQDFFEPFRRLFSLPALPLSELKPHFSTEPYTLPALPTPKKTVHIGVIPGVGGKRPNRQWPKEYYISLITSFNEENHLNWHLIGGPDEIALAKDIETKIKDQFSAIHITNHCGKHSILETANLLSSLNLVIGGDTGPLHLAAASGTNTIGLYAPTDTRRTGPEGNQTNTLTPPKEVSCWPCERPLCVNAKPKYRTCMAEISVEDVATQVKAQLKLS